MEVFSSDDEDMVILEACSSSEIGNMLVFSNPPSSYFYLYLPFIKDMRVVFPLSPFSMEVLRVLNVVPPKCSLIVGVISLPSRRSART